MERKLSIDLKVIAALMENESPLDDDVKTFIQHTVYSAAELLEPKGASTISSVSQT